MGLQLLTLNLEPLLWMGMNLAVFKQDGKMPSSKDWLVSFASIGERTLAMHL